MRTPGNDAELALGFLFTEGIIKQLSDTGSTTHCFINCAQNKENVVQISLKEGVIPVLNNTERNFYTTSSCGVCGKTSINSIKTVSAFENTGSIENQINTDLLYLLPSILQKHQEVFSFTGGLHACAFFDTAGELILVREDIGRHNALDKLIGVALNNEMLPLNQHVLLLSGRASFELVQKAAMGGINIIAAVGAPSSLAVQLADEFNITLVGFLRGKRFNIYTHPNRILLAKHEDASRERKFKTEKYGDKAAFSVTKLPDNKLADDEYVMATIRSHDQFNTTIYGLEDRYRGIHNERRVIFMNQKDIDREGLKAGDRVDLYNYGQGIKRVAKLFVIVPYNIPERNTATYYPETNVLVPIGSVAIGSNTPVSKRVIIKIKKHAA
jgi:FdhD protein